MSEASVRASGRRDNFPVFRTAAGKRSESVANCFARGFARLTGDNHKWHGHRKYRVPRLHRRLPTRASAYSGLHVFVLLAWTAPGAAWLSCSATLWDETRGAGLYHFIEPLPSLNSI